jgi:hypothetical protein
MAPFTEKRRERIRRRGDRGWPSHGKAHEPETPTERVVEDRQ